MLLVLRLSYILWLFLWMPLSISMETSQETTTKEEEEKSYLQLLAPDTLKQIGYFFTGPRTTLVGYQGAVQNIKNIPALINNPANLAAMIKRLSTRYNIKPYRVALSFNNATANDWLKSYFKENFEAKKDEAEDALFIAADKGDPEITKFLLEAGVDPNIKTKEFDRPLLMEAISSFHSNPEVVKLLLDKGSNPNATDKEFNTPLMAAVNPLPYARKDSRPNPEIVKLLLDKGANPNIHSERYSPLLEVLLDRFEDKSLATTIAKLLLEAKANPNFVGLIHTPLTAAVDDNNIDAIKALLEKNANINIFSKLNISPLIHAIDSINPDLVKYLIQAGADVNLKADSGDPRLIPRIPLRAAENKLKVIYRPSEEPEKEKKLEEIIQTLQNAGAR
jgi:ankyrin repeat protein